MKTRVMVNGMMHVDDVEPRTLLVHYLRETLRLTGTHIGCDTSQCGACVVHVNGQPVKSCTLLAVQADGTDVMTIEGLSGSGEIKDLQEEFHNRNSPQCGFCTPGMLMAAAELLKLNPNATRREIREFLSGNYCRCTGYQAIVDAVEAVGQLRNGGPA